MDERFKDYKFRINLINSDQYDPMRETVEVWLTTRDAQKYHANFTTKDFINYMFEKNKRTGECAKGAYFCMPNMIIVEKISEQNVRATIEDLINNLEIETHFKKID